MAIEVDPLYSFPYNNRGFAYLKLGELDKAIEDINHSIKLDPDNSYAYKNRALCYLEYKDKEAALVDLKLAWALGFEEKYGNEVNNLIQQIEEETKGENLDSDNPESNATIINNLGYQKLFAEKMKYIIISDTHGLHHELVLPKGDIIIHAGDISDHGSKDEIKNFLDWFSKLDFKYKIFIGGNHDIYLDENSIDLLEILPSNVIYLNNNGCEINGIKFWGSPVSPDLVDWAFGKYRNEMEDHWKYLPEEIDILITHTPPLGILDKSSAHASLGCKDLLKKVKEIKPTYHIFGHIHNSYGIEKIENTTFINASNINSYQGLINPPIAFEL